uniref:Uncharacterized protein n=1 Tax=viral metagenome TaxID=1070528 RepID=A0A6C0JVA5_9ZZZZ
MSKSSKGDTSTSGDEDVSGEVLVEIDFTEESSEGSEEYESSREDEDDEDIYEYSDEVMEDSGYDSQGEATIIKEKELKVVEVELSSDSEGSDESESSDESEDEPKPTKKSKTTKKPKAKLVKKPKTKTVKRPSKAPVKSKTSSTILKPIHIHRGIQERKEDFSYRQELTQAFIEDGMAETKAAVLANFVFQIIIGNPVLDTELKNEIVDLLEKTAARRS